MLKPVKYHVLSAESVESLSSTVNTMFGMGWSLYEGLKTTNHRYYQVMVQYEEKVCS